MSEGKGPSDLTRRLGGVLRGAQDRSLGRRAVRAGFITGEELERALESAAPGALEALLLSKGAAPDDFRRLRDEVDRDDFALFRPERRLPPEVQAALGEPGRRLAEFVLVSRLGRGGLGEVWKAWDTRLGRWVAVKLPNAKPDDEAAAKRFTREALAAARLSHPNIVSIHRVAEEDGRAFIVMQYVEGRTLNGLRLSLREALEAMRTVALAVHYAHEQGVIHRDIKPGNIMVAADGRAFVLDFGLAHLQEAGRTQSREGLVAGTAAYMSPEQARGEPAARERATDVYSLGATLYETVTARAPYSGETFADTLEKVLHREAPAPRSLVPALPRDVETVVLKAMEKAPGRRYGTARDLADDLDRCLRDEPVAARRSTFRTVVARRARRHAGLLTTAAVLAVVGGGALAVTRYESRRTEDLERERAVRARELGEREERLRASGEREREQAGRFEASRREQEAKLQAIRKEQESRTRAIRELSRVSLQAALELRRAGANERMSEFLPSMESSYREAVASAPEVAEIDYLMGRVQRAVMNESKARELQKSALAKDPDYAPALYESIVLGAKAYGRELRRARAGSGVLPPGPVTPEAARAAAGRDPAQSDPALARLREALARDCERLEALLAKGWEREGAARMGKAHGLAARGILAFHRGDAPAARPLLQQALAAVPGMEEAWEALAESWFSGVGCTAAPEEQERAYAEAERAFAEGLARDRGYVPHWVGRAGVRAARAALRSQTGKDPAVDFQAAEDDLTEALRLGPSAEVLGRRAMLRASLGLHRMRLGENPVRDFAEAESDLERALVLAPDDPASRSRRAFVNRHRAEYGMSRGESPLEKADLVERDASAAIKADPALAAAWMNRAVAWSYRAAYRSGRGEDASADFSRAEEDFGEALRRNPESPEAWERRGFLWMERARARRAAGSDPAPDLARAEGDLDRALELGSFFTRARVTRASVLRLKAAVLETAGKDPAPAFSAALRDLTVALAAAPASTDTWVERGHLESDWGAWRVRAGDRGGARDHFVEVVRSFEEAIRLDPFLTGLLREPLREGRRALLGQSQPLGR
jgi:serine/threonine-protein kinase